MREVKITLGNSYSKIEGLTTDQFRKLKRKLSYTTDPQAAYFSGGWARRKYLIDAKGSFPSGLLVRVLNFLKNNNIDWKKPVEWPNKPVSIPGMFTLNLTQKPHWWQDKAARMAVRQERGGIVAPTGTGKSLVIALIASRLNVRTLVVVPTLEIKKQLSESLLELFGANDNIVVQNIDNMLLRNYQDFDCLIIDECHHVAAKTYHKLNKTVWNKIHYRYFLTATFFRNDTNEQLLFEGIAGQVIYRLTYKQAVEKGYIVPVEAYYIDVPKQNVDCDRYNEVYQKLVVNNSPRNTIIAKLLDNLDDNAVHTLCLVKEIRHGGLLSMMTGLPFVNGQDDDSRDCIRQFNNGTQKALIGTTGILGEGIDTKPAEYIFIAGLGKAKSAFMQQVGRGVRKYPGKESCKVILFRDESHKFTLRHYNEQCKILKEEFGVEPMKLEIA